MSQMEKLLLKFQRRPTPTDIRFEEADRLLRYFGFVSRQPSGGGSHHTYGHPRLRQCRLTIVGGGGTLKKVYVRKIVEIIEKVQQLDALEMKD